jgi:glutamyl-tRNA synthetase
MCVHARSKRICSEHAARLLAAGDAYRCFCSPDRLLLMRREALTRREVVRYDRRCAQLTETEIAQKLEAKQAFTVGAHTF